MHKRLWFLSVLIGVSLFGGSATAGATSGIVRRSGRFLTVNGSPLYFNGFNQYHLFYKPEQVVDEVLRNAVWFGGNTYIRTWAFCNGTSADGYCFQPQPGVYDEATFRKLDFVLAQANLYELRVVLSLVNNWDDFGGMNQYLSWCGVTSGHDAFYTDSCAKQLYKNYVQQVLSRVNTITGVPYKDDPAILAWELANEPRCPSDPSGNTLLAWIQEMAAYVKSLDPNHLVATGEEGWYTSKGPDWRHNGTEGVDFLRNSAVAEIDVASFHLYPEPYLLDEPGAMAWIDEHISDAHSVIGKPVLLGEFGWKVPRQLFGGFSVGTETWRVDWGFDLTSPQRVVDPSEDGNGALWYTGAIPSGGSAAGERQFSDPGLDLSNLDLLRMAVYIPADAPTDLQAVLYTKSGPNWVWREGMATVLVPGQWTALTFPISWAFQSTSIRSVGVKVFNGASQYTSGIGVDGVTAISTQPGRMLADRQRIYNDWYGRLDVNDADGAMAWILHGHETDTTWTPDYDGYGVYVPEDQPMLLRIQEYSARMADKSATPPGALPTVAIQMPSSGATLSGLVTVSAQVSDDQGVTAVIYRVDGGPAQSMVHVGAEIWEATWDTTATPDGSHILAVEATDTTGLTGAASQPVTVQNASDQLPTVSIQSPASGIQVSGAVLIQANATDDLQVMGVSYRIDGGPIQLMSLINGTWQASWDSTAVANGLHSITVEVTDSANQTVSSSVDVDVRNIPANVLYVQSITVTLKQRGGGWKRGLAQVAVVDGRGQPIGNVKVFTRWSGAASDTDIGTTGSTGVTGIIRSNETRAAAGYFRLTVEKLTKSGYTHDPSYNMETSDQINF
ncbi:MAG: cellulase family glycosylhydrolase [Candidatus Omnitrophica bacterium]|nr:cellulase family glycosylhydrolase [Candidatus Omnitrophota bacterium]